MIDQIRITALHRADNAAIWSLNEPVLVYGGIGCQTTNQTDVRTFWGFNWADTPVVREVNVAHVKASALAAQTARTKSRDGTLVAQLRKRVGLLHELGKLAGAKELAQGCHQRADIDKADG